jgi:hypothetical protein
VSVVTELISVIGASSAAGAGGVLKRPAGHGFVARA